MSGAAWASDRFFSGGRSGTIKPTVRGVESEAADDLYRTRRVFDPAELGPGYRLPVPDGEYTVTIHCVNVARAPGCVVSDVLVEGEPVLESWDLYAEGGFGLALRRELAAVEVRDGTLEIEFRPRIVPVGVSAIEVRRTP